MLPTEVLKVIFGALSRDELDTLMLTNALFRNIVLRDFAKEPLRYLASLHIHGQQSYVFELTHGNEAYCEDDDEFNRRMRLARVGIMQFSDAQVEEDIFQVLVPFKEAWRDGHISMRRCFASASLLERAFSELFFCKNIFVDIDVRGEIGQPFLSLPAVRECASLNIFRFPSVWWTTVQVTEWIYADAGSQEPRRLELCEDDLGDSPEDLVRQLMTVSRLFSSF